MTHKTLIAIVNARSRQHSWAEAVRSTWFKQTPSDKSDVKFFVGRGDSVVLEDTVELDCDDSYLGLPDKVREIVRYAYSHEYRYVLKCDDDVILKPNLWLKSGYDEHKYSGRANRRPNARDNFYIPMGFFYVMDRECMGFVKDASLPSPHNNDDERWVAKILFENGIELHDDKRAHLYMGGLKDIPPRVNRPLRIGTRAQTEIKFENAFAWCVFMETGGREQKIPVEKKIEEFHRIFQKYGERL